MGPRGGLLWMLLCQPTGGCESGVFTFESIEYTDESLVSASYPHVNVCCHYPEIIQDQQEECETKKLYEAVEWKIEK